MDDQTSYNAKKIVAMTAAGVVMGAASEAAFQRAGINRGFWERILPLAIFLILIGAGLIWGYALGDQVTTLNACSNLISNADFCATLWPTE
jgi:hypothetical protein